MTIERRALLLGKVAMLEADVSEIVRECSIGLETVEKALKSKGQHEIELLKFSKNLDLFAAKSGLQEKFEYYSEFGRHLEGIYEVLNEVDGRLESAVVDSFEQHLIELQFEIGSTYSDLFDLQRLG